MKKRIFYEVSSRELELLVRKYIEKKHEGCKIFNITAITSNDLACGMDIKKISFRATLDVNVENIEELNKLTQMEVVATSDYAKPMVDDVIVVTGINQAGRSITRASGHVFRITQAARDFWIMRPIKKSQQGKFTGTSSDSDNKSKIYRLEKDPKDTSRMFKIISVCRFPDNFTWKEHWISEIVQGEIKQEEMDGK